MGNYVLRPDETVLGHGWHAPEGPEGAEWRWSGPTRRSALILPNLFAGNFRVVLYLTVTDAEVIPEQNFVRVGSKLRPYTVTWPQALRPRVIFETGATATQPDVLLELACTKTVHSHPEAPNRSRRLGVCVNRIVCGPLDWDQDS